MFDFLFWNTSKRFAFVQIISFDIETFVLPFWYHWHYYPRPSKATHSNSPPSLLSRGDAPGGQASNILLCQGQSRRTEEKKGLRTAGRNRYQEAVGGAGGEVSSIVGRQVPPGSFYLPLYHPLLLFHHFNIKWNGWPLLPPPSLI